jgi:hypothetical protein
LRPPQGRGSLDSTRSRRLRQRATAKGGRHGCNSERCPPAGFGETRATFRASGVARPSPRGATAGRHRRKFPSRGISRGKKWFRSDPSKRPGRRQQFLKPPPGAARAEVVASEFFLELLVAVHDAVAAADLRLRRIALPTLGGDLERRGSRRGAGDRQRAWDLLVRLREDNGAPGEDFKWDAVCASGSRRTSPPHANEGPACS